METFLITAGVICVIGAIIGGGIKIAGNELKEISSAWRQILLGIFGVGLLVSGPYLKNTKNPSPVQDIQAKEAVAVVAPDGPESRGLTATSMPPLTTVAGAVTKSAFSPSSSPSSPPPAAECNDFSRRRENPRLPYIINENGNGCNGELEVKIAYNGLAAYPNVGGGNSQSSEARIDMFDLQDGSDLCAGQLGARDRNFNSFNIFCVGKVRVTKNSPASIRLNLYRANISDSDHSPLIVTVKFSAD